MISGLSSVGNTITQLKNEGVNVSASSDAFEGTYTTQNYNGPLPDFFWRSKAGSSGISLDTSTSLGAVDINNYFYGNL